MKIAVVGATGAVGRMMLTVLQEQNIRPNQIGLFASARSANTTLPFYGQQVKVQELTTQQMQQSWDYVLFSAGGKVALQYAPVAAAAGAVVIDNSSAFRRNNANLLCVPGINCSNLKGYRGIVANPNCSTIQAVLALAPLNKQFGLKSLVISTYQAVSGAGQQGVLELLAQRDGSTTNGVFSRMIDKNVVPQIGDLQPDGFYTEEDKLSYEINKILGLHIPVTATCVRVPVLNGHAESIWAEFEQAQNLELAAELLQKAPGVKFYPKGFITPQELEDNNYSHVCRLRNAKQKNAVSLWNVADNLRLGAAYNAVLILKKHKELNYD